MVWDGVSSCARAKQWVPTVALCGHPARRVLGVCVRDGRLHVVTPVYERGSLAQRITENGGLAAGEVAEVAVQVLEGLRELHERGIVHGGVKPANVLVEEGGGVVLADYRLGAVAERMGVPVSGGVQGRERGAKAAHGFRAWVDAGQPVAQRTGQRGCVRCAKPDGPFAWLACSCS